jgi:hypothetical protein
MELQDRWKSIITAIREAALMTDSPDTKEFPVWIAINSDGDYDVSTDSAEGAVENLHDNTGTADAERVVHVTITAELPKITQVELNADAPHVGTGIGIKIGD